MGADGRCDPAQLQITVRARTDKDPQLVAVDLLLTNKGTLACIVSGTPAVSITGAVSGASIGVATAYSTDPGRPVTIQPKDSAYIFLETLQSMADTPTCMGELAQGIRVVLPGATEAQAYVTSSPVAKYCDEPSRRTFVVSAISEKPLEVAGIDPFVPRG
jgi:hypothetical protein